LPVKDGVEEDAPTPFQAGFVLAFGEEFFEVFPLAFGKIAWVSLFHRRKNLPTFFWRIVPFLTFGNYVWLDFRQLLGVEFVSS
jgi:hypothetical protein